MVKIRSSPCRFYHLQREFERDGRCSAEGARKGRQMRKPSTLKAEACFNGWLL